MTNLLFLQMVVAQAVLASATCYIAEQADKNPIKGVLLAVTPALGMFLATAYMVWCYQKAGR